MLESLNQSEAYQKPWLWYHYICFIMMIISQISIWIFAFKTNLNLVSVSCGFNLLFLLGFIDGFDIPITSNRRWTALQSRSWLHTLLDSSIITSKLIFLQIDNETFKNWFTFFLQKYFLKQKIKRGQGPLGTLTPINDYRLID